MAKMAIALALFLQDPLIEQAAAILVQCQEQGQWPYEGVYREERQIPMGYRVGGTAFCAIALLKVPGKANREAVDRAAAYVLEGLQDLSMAPASPAGYDVRAWGYVYAILFLLKLDKSPKTSQAIEFCISGLEKMELGETGGWNYAGTRPRAPASTFMTAPAIQALREAKAKGYKVPDARIERAIAALEKCRREDGAFQYGTRHAEGFDALEGAAGRSPLCEATLLMAGKGSVERVTGALDNFFKNWEWLEQRRQKNRTHEPPYMIAPYYFFFAHACAAQAIELLPEAKRPEYRKKLRERLMQVQDKDGSWNDRVFPRSKNFGTACAILVLTQAP